MKLFSSNFFKGCFKSSGNFSLHDIIRTSWIKNVLSTLHVRLSPIVHTFQNVIQISPNKKLKGFVRIVFKERYNSHFETRTVEASPCKLHYPMQRSSRWPIMFKINN